MTASVLIGQVAKDLGWSWGERLQIVIDADHLANNPDCEVWDTFLHELAHALTPCHQHDAVWQAQAQALGCSHVEVEGHTAPVHSEHYSEPEC